MIWVADSLGRPVARALLYPICFYFVLSSGAARRSVSRFRERVVGRRASWLEMFRHFHVFASTILDRLYFLRARLDSFDIQFRGLDVLDRELAKGQGCVLLGAHLGSFEVVRAVGMFRRQLDIRVLMDEGNAPMIRSLIQELNPAVADTVIQIGGVETMLQVKECLDRGGVVGVMGDRVTRNDQTVSCKFFGKDAQFPTGPIRLARVTRAPVILFFGLYRGGNRYEVHLEACCLEETPACNPGEVNVARAVQQYADRLEEFCRQAPENWFNFYDFWHEGH